MSVLSKVKIRKTMIKEDKATLRKLNHKYDVAYSEFLASEDSY